MKTSFNLAAILLSSLMLTACSSQSAVDRNIEAEQLAQRGNLTPLAVDTRLPIKAWGRIAPDKPIHVYIEGDGHAWRNSHLPSMDPTPHDPVGLKLAAADGHESVLYLGRPCQYQVDTARGCHFSVWTARRFAETADIKAALQQLAGEQELILIGFSGGANIAIQLAADFLQVKAPQMKKPQVKGLVTVAGNLEAGSFNRFHRSSQEKYGHNQALLAQLVKLPQLHYTGSKDKIIPPALTHQQLADIKYSHCVRVSEVTNAKHNGPWSIDWSAFSALQQNCVNGQ